MVQTASHKYVNIFKEIIVNNIVGRIVCHSTHVKRIRTKVRLGTHCSAMHDGIVLGLGRHLEQQVVGQRQLKAAPQHRCILVGRHI